VHAFKERAAETRPPFLHMYAEREVPDIAILRKGRSCRELAIAMKEPAACQLLFSPRFSSVNRYS
jgi:hypothetical protein